MYGYTGMKKVARVLLRARLIYHKENDRIWSDLLPLVKVNWSEQLKPQA